jgi:transglutaminase-like putative cysteine protease
MIALVRQLKIPYRYVSGYLFHADRAKDRSPAGATHAWVAAYLEEFGWVAFDPPNDLPGCERHVRVTIGRDYADVPPARGVHKGEAGSELSVTVSVSPADATEPADLPAARVTRFKPPSGPAGSEFEQQFQEQQ